MSSEQTVSVRQIILFYAMLLLAINAIECIYTLDIEQVLKNKNFLCEGPWSRGLDPCSFQKTPI